MSRLSVAVGSALRVYNSNGVLPASIRAESAGVYRIERALSEGASSLSAPRPRPAQAEPRAHAWLLLAQLCLRYAHARARTTRTHTHHAHAHARTTHTRATHRHPALQVGAGERGGGLRGGGGRTHALQPPRLVHREFRRLIVLYSLNVYVIYVTLCFCLFCH